VHSGFGNSIYQILPFVTTVIHFTTLQHINQRLWVCYSILLFVADESSLLSSWLHAELWTPELSLVSLYLCLHLSAIPLRGFFADWIDSIWSKGFVYPLSRKRQLRYAGNVCLRCCENNCLPSRYNGNTSVRCLGNDPSTSAFRHFVTLCFGDNCVIRYPLTVEIVGRLKQAI
jgi:hypothetical protein